MNKTLFRISFIFCLFWHVQFNQANASITYCSKNVEFADELMEKGAVNTACFILKKELKNPAFTISQQHQILKLIADCYLKELDLVHYVEYNRKAYELVKNSNPIYKAEYFMERVYLFHFLT
jgi:homogentisate 1,2-dioxygenase